MSQKESAKFWRGGTAAAKASSEVMARAGCGERLCTCLYRSQCCGAGVCLPYWTKALKSGSTAVQEMKMNKSNKVTMNKVKFLSVALWLQYAPVQAQDINQVKAIDAEQFQTAKTTLKSIVKMILLMVQPFFEMFILLKTLLIQLRLYYKAGL
jgi:hypothetical protein